MLTRSNWLTTKEKLLRQMDQLDIQTFSPGSSQLATCIKMSKNIVIALLRRSKEIHEVNL